MPPDEIVGVLTKQVVALPGGLQNVSRPAAKLGALMDKTGQFFVRGRALVRLAKDDSHHPILHPVRAAALPSIFESVADLVGDKGKPKICSESSARLILHAQPFIEKLPHIVLLSACPVLIERNGSLEQICDFDRASGILAAGERVPDISLSEAKTLLDELVAEFRFSTTPDRFRALAAIITPALMFSGLLPGRAPLDLTEADASQAGKGFRNKLTAAVYGQTVKTVAPRSGGVGSLEESFSSALVRGANFISLGNVRGRMDSMMIESFLTEDHFLARVPYQDSAEIDPRRVVVQFTSNQALITPDLANRSSIVRILKQPPEFQFAKFAEGDILDHVRENQPDFLAAVFAVVRAWHAAGKPRSPETRHDFRGWVQVLDWIVGPGIMEGHRDTQTRMATSNLGWLRGVCLAIARAKRMDGWLKASDILDIVAKDPGISVPGAEDTDDLDSEAVREKLLLGIGRRLASSFIAADRVEIDRLMIERREGEDGEGRRRREYRVVEVAQTPIAGPPPWKTAAPNVKRNPPMPAIGDVTLLKPQRGPDASAKSLQRLEADGGYGGDCNPMKGRMAGHGGNVGNGDFGGQPTLREDAEEGEWIA